MTDREFLERRTRDVKTRLGRHSAAVNEELERAVGPLVREHPRTSLAAGAAVGVALGAALKPTARVARGSVSGVCGFLKRTAGYALRVKLVGAFLSGNPDRDNEPGG